MPFPPHPAVAAAHAAAAAIIKRSSVPADASFWQRWFDGPGERHAFDDVRAFSHALRELRSVPPTMISPAELAMVGDDVNQVVEWIDTWLHQPDHAAESGPLSAAVYVIRRRYEEIHHRGATKT